MNHETKIILHSVTNEEHNSFVGLRIRNGEIHFYYPESYDLGAVAGKDVITLDSIADKRTFRIDVVNILRTISLAKSRSSMNHASDNGISQSEQFAIMSYIWIIRDYLSNGYYRNSEKLYRTNGKGKINWKKTLETQPIISNGNIIYDKLVVEVRNDCDDVITEAHKWCVFDSVRKIGWLFGINEKSVFVPRAADSIIKKYIRSIKTELARTFDDIKKMRLNHMLKVLTGVDDSNRAKEIVYGVDKYHYVYERMVDYVFSNVADITKYNPNAQWYLCKNNFNPTDASSLRPDTVRLVPKAGTDEKVAYIIDAKFYRFGTTGSESDLPSTTSIQKQITYGDHIIANLRGAENIDSVRNAFIIPYNKNKNDLGCNEDLVYIGYAKANWRRDQLSHEKVHAFLMDTKHLICVWSRGNCKEDIEKLVSDIEANTSKRCEKSLDP